MTGSDRSSTYPTRSLRFKNCFTPLSTLNVGPSKLNCRSFHLSLRPPPLSAHSLSFTRIGRPFLISPSFFLRGRSFARNDETFVIINQRNPCSRDASFFNMGRQVGWVFARRKGKEAQIIFFWRLDSGSVTEDKWNLLSLIRHLYY